MMKRNQRVKIENFQFDSFPLLENNISFQQKLCKFPIAVDLFQQGKFSKNFLVQPPGELDQVQSALEKLLSMLQHLIGYVDDVIVS